MSVIRLFSRYCTEDAWFTIREIDVGLCADVGVLQRLPKVVGNGSLVNEWALTGRKIDSKEARLEGLVSKVVKDKDELMKTTLELAKFIAAKSPVAAQGTKVGVTGFRGSAMNDLPPHVYAESGCFCID